MENPFLAHMLGDVHTHKIISKKHTYARLLPSCEPENSSMPFILMENTQNLNINYAIRWLPNFTLSCRNLSATLTCLLEAGTSPGLIEVMRWDVEWAVAAKSPLIMAYTPELSEQRYCLPLYKKYRQLLRPYKTTGFP